MLKFKISKSAQIDIETQADWCNKKQAGLGDKFYRNTKIAIDKLLKNAAKFEVKYHIANTIPVRFCRVNKNFPFLIHYIIQNDTVIILGILHEASEHQKKILNR